MTPNLWQIPGLTSEVFVKNEAVQTFRSIEFIMISFASFYLHTLVSALMTGL